MDPTANATLRSDFKYRSQAFSWYGPVAPKLLQEWITQRRLDVPSDLVALWQWLGGGVIFETEEILAPLGGGPHALDFDETNRSHWAKGLSDGVFVFHAGLWVSAVRAESPRYVTLEFDSYATVGEFGSLDDWYRLTIRAECAQRYGLQELS